MIRVLFSVLAVVVAVLAIVLKQPVLYVIAAALLLVVVGVWMNVLRQRHRETVQPYIPSTKAPPLPEEDLKSLGILDIRPKDSSSPSNRDDNRSAEAIYAPMASPGTAVPPPKRLKEFVIPPPRGKDADERATTDIAGRFAPVASQTKDSVPLSPHQEMVPRALPYRLYMLRLACIPSAC